MDVSTLPSCPITCLHATVLHASVSTPRRRVQYAHALRKHPLDAHPPLHTPCARRIRTTAACSQPRHVRLRYGCIYSKRHEHTSLGRSGHGISLQSTHWNSEQYRGNRLGDLEST